jgi:hypothetical protein
MLAVCGATFARLFWIKLFVARRAGRERYALGAMNVTGRAGAGAGVWPTFGISTPIPM